ncbi:MAG TPA: GGDEF domain-containing protein [Pirellulaceae bacterium]|nr:GGDEF domain-containing protein [Pirellulaceae bacterium]
MDLTALSLPATVALATVAVIGYLVGRRRSGQTTELNHARRELKRAKAVIRELESISNHVRSSLSQHQTSMATFKDRLGALGSENEGAAWQQLCEEAERILRPTMRLSNEIAQAYDEIRQQTHLLMTFTEVRTDPLTGVSNRRALDETLNNLFAMKSRYQTSFSIIIFDLDHFKQVNDKYGHLQGDRILREVAHHFDDAVRETDVVARFGGEEFVLVLPQTELAGACLLADRIREVVEQKMQITISGGVAIVLDGDTPGSLLARADSSLYSAKAAGRNRVYRHDGDRIEAVTGTPWAELPEVPAASAPVIKETVRNFVPVKL